MKPRITFGALRQPGNQAADADWTPACPHRMPRSALFVPRERCDQPQNPPATKFWTASRDPAPANDNPETGTFSCRAPGPDPRLARFAVPVRLHDEADRAGCPANAGDRERYPAGTQPPSTWITWPLM